MRFLFSHFSVALTTCGVCYGSSILWELIKVVQRNVPAKYAKRTEM